MPYLRASHFHRFTFVAALCGLGWPMLAYSKSMDFFRLDGRINLEVLARDQFNDTDFNKEAVLQLGTKRKQGLKGYVDVRFSSDSWRVDVRDIILDYKFPEQGNRVIVGKAKKRFGLEWDFNLEEVLTLTRGSIYRKLASLGYIGRDSLLAYQVGSPGKSPVQHNLSIHSSEGMNAAILYRLVKELDGASFLTSYSLFQLDEINEKWNNPGGAQALSYYGIHDSFRVDAEAFFGVDPFETEYNRISGQSRTVFFTAASVGTVWLAHRLQPFLSLAAILNDLAHAGNRTLELTAGARYFFMPRFYAGLEGRVINNRVEGVSAFDSNSHGLLALRYFF